MCTAFTTLQRLNYAKSQDKGKMRQAHMQACVNEFVAELYREQLADGGCFLYEHPRSTSSWNLDCMKRLRDITSADIVRGH